MDASNSGAAIAFGMMNVDLHLCRKHYSKSFPPGFGPGLFHHRRRSFLRFESETTANKLKL